jgi:hypothetical protein
MQHHGYTGNSKHAIAPVTGHVAGFTPLQGRQHCHGWFPCATLALFEVDDISALHE